MAPRVKIRREELVAAAVELVRREGAQALNARSLAAALRCSTQPVFSNFATMDELRAAVLEAAEAICGDYVARETARGRYPAYKAGGMAYIRFAMEERELFKMLYMRDRRGETIRDDDALTRQTIAQIRENTGLPEGRAQLFHLEMWAFVHGVAVIQASGYMPLDEELISWMLTDVFQGLKARFDKEGSA